MICNMLKLAPTFFCALNKVDAITVATNNSAIKDGNEASAEDLLNLLTSDNNPGSGNSFGDSCVRFIGAYTTVNINLYS